MTEVMSFDEVLAHHGIKGMHWGVRNSSSSSGSSSHTLTSGQKRAIFIVATTGAAATAAMLAGPLAGMAVSGLARAADSAFGTQTTTTNTWGDGSGNIHVDRQTTNS